MFCQSPARAWPVVRNRNYKGYISIVELAFDRGQQNRKVWGQLTYNWSRSICKSNTASVGNSYHI